MIIIQPWDEGTSVRLALTRGDLARLSTLLFDASRMDSDQLREGLSSFDWRDPFGDKVDAPALEIVDDVSSEIQPKSTLKTIWVYTAMTFLLLWGVFGFVGLFLTFVHFLAWFG